MPDKKKSEKAAKPGETKCGREYTDRYGIKRRCNRKWNHWPLKCSG